jgi:GNAT superfamily N-acetyltransferase
MLSQAKIIHVQEIANNSWRAKDFYWLNGWLLRFNEGVTGRANSVLPSYYWGTDLIRDIKLVENAYEQHNLPARWQMHEGHAPIELYNTLESRGYRQDPLVEVMGTDLLRFDGSIQKKASSFQVTSTAMRTKEWSRAFIDLTTHRDRQELEKMCEIMDQITVPHKRFLVAHKEDQQAGVVFGVVDRRFLGIMDLVVAPQYRRKGLATKLITDTVDWAYQHSATSLYLQVVAENHAAIALYQKMGLLRWFNYFYLTQT